MKYSLHAGLQLTVKSTNWWTDDTYVKSEPLYLMLG